jgi:hypothetical protein
MYQPMLFLHWKQARLPLLPFVVGAFGLPLLSIQGFGYFSDDVSLGSAFSALAGLSLPLYPILAFLIGVAIALTAWNWDHQLNHVYALSLPLARWEYAMLKMGAGVLITLIPTAAFWLGAQLASAAVVLPEGLHTYPNELTFRFFLAVLLSYAVVFAMAAGTVRTSLVAMVAVYGALIVWIWFIGSFEMGDAALEYLWRAGGPLEVFTGSWALIDV